MDRINRMDGWIGWRWMDRMEMDGWIGWRWIDR